MRKVGLIFVMAFCLMPLVFALNIDVDKTDKGSVIISELNNPAVFEFLIHNYGSEENVQIYSLLGIPMSPVGNFDIPSGDSKTIVKVYPNREIRRNSGFYNFEYQIKGDGSDIFKDTLTVRIVNLDEAIEISSKNIIPGDNDAFVIVKGKENTNLENVNIKFKSAFFEHTDTISLKPFEEKQIKISIDKEDIKKLNAGQYVITAEISLENVKTRIEGNINYLEKEGISVVEDSTGLFLRKNTIKKTNEGNVPVTAKIEVKKDILTRLFTVYSLEHISYERRGIFVNYIWEKELGPSESVELVVTTSYVFPFVLIILIALISFFAYKYYGTNLRIDKRVSFVKTKGGEFALKVRLHVKAKKAVENIKIIDRIPGSTQLYEQAGTKPDKIDHSTRRLIWNINRLNSGEERVFSYIIYSKLKIVGKFELPSATAIYQSNGKTQEIFSNKTYFMNETIERSD